MSKRPHHLGHFPEVADALLSSALHRHFINVGDDAFSLNEYTDRDRNTGIHGKAVVALLPLIQCLYRVQPQGRFRPKQMQRAIASVTRDAQEKQHVQLNKSGWPIKVWARFVSKQILILLAHVRNALNHDDIFVRAFEKLPEEDYMKMIRFKEEILPSSATASSSSDKKKRKLQCHLSEASVDSTAFNKAMASDNDYSCNGQDSSASSHLSKSSEGETDVLSMAFAEKK